jgi:hypothetical protein
MSAVFRFCVNTKDNSVVHTCVVYEVHAVCCAILPGGKSQTCSDLRDDVACR